MANWIEPTITALGKALKVKVDAGAILTFTKMKTGDGDLTNVDLENMTDLVNAKQELLLTGKSTNTENNTVRITSTVSNTLLTEGYNITELGVYAQDPDNGEILFCVTRDENPDYMQAQGDATTPITIEIGVNIGTSTDTQTTIVVDSAGIATINDVNELMDNHKNNNQHVVVSTVEPTNENQWIDIS